MSNIDVRHHGHGCSIQWSRWSKLWTQRVCGGRVLNSHEVLLYGAWHTVAWCVTLIKSGTTRVRLRYHFCTSTTTTECWRGPTHSSISVDITMVCVDGTKIIATFEETRGPRTRNTIPCLTSYVLRNSITHFLMTNTKSIPHLHYTSLKCCNHLHSPCEFNIYISSHPLTSLLQPSSGGCKAFATFQHTHSCMTGHHINGMQTNVNHTPCVWRCLTELVLKRLSNPHEISKCHDIGAKVARTDSPYLSLRYKD